MKKVLWMVGGLCAATAGFLVFGARCVRPVDEIVPQPEEAWTDHITSV
ncbi:hypothetical protein [Granulicella arctica]|uniref:Uncharacterized protein n=1 Tax=Granulicella arctica TaxID=940613 RepID=A0A7Y9TKG9_9BACT|nr:hypothetical protein [Granulicella arctica]NYF79227.1 hypothetical protein [Granulicella arctica]